MKALIHKNKIVQVQETIFPVSPGLKWEDVPEDCTTEWKWDGKKASKPDPIPTPETSPIDLAKEELKKIKADQAGKSLSMVYLDKRLTEIETILGV